MADQAEPAASCSEDSVQECDPGGELGRQAGFSEKPAGPGRAAGSWEPEWVQLSEPTSQSDGSAQGEDGCRHEAVYLGTTRETDSHDSCGGQGGTPASQLICLG